MTISQGGLPDTLSSLILSFTPLVVTEDSEINTLWNM